jgi:xanthosine phosphorylase
MALPIRALRAAGCDTLIVTNAAGSLRPELGPGGLMTITDHINWAGVNPLAGPNDGELGPRFPDMTEAYDPALRIELHEAARAAGVELREGVYLMYPGPNFETPAEIRAFAALGADATGMSTVPECLVANHCGMRVAAISVITNLAAGIGGHCLSHQDTLATAQAAAGRLGELLFRFLPRIAP